MVIFVILSVDNLRMLLIITSENILISSTNVLIVVSRILVYLDLTLIGERNSVTQEEFQVLIRHLQEKTIILNYQIHQYKDQQIKK